jgi:hypothetical protein
MCSSLSYLLKSLVTHFSASSLHSSNNQHHVIPTAVSQLGSEQHTCLLPTGKSDEDTDKQLNLTQSFHRLETFHLLGCESFQE